MRKGEGREGAKLAKRSEGSEAAVVVMMRWCDGAMERRSEGWRTDRRKGGTEGGGGLARAKEDGKVESE